jgi:hypothetical protein
MLLLEYPFILGRIKYQCYRCHLRKRKLLHAKLKAEAIAGKRYTAPASVAAWL